MQRRVELLKANGWNTAKAVETSTYTRNQLEHTRRLAAAAGYEIPAAAGSFRPGDINARLAERQAAIDAKAQRAHVKALEAELADRQRLTDTLLCFNGRAERPLVIAPPAEKSTRSPIAAVVQLTDMHYGETVRANATLGLRAYNPAVARRRAEAFAVNVSKLVRHKLAGEGRDLAGLVLVLGGDMLSGEIHDELAATNAVTNQQAVEDLLDIIGGVVAHLVAEFGRLYVVGVPGNHGRLTRKPWAKGYAERNADWLLYRLLKREAAARHGDAVTVHVPADRDARIVVLGNRLLITHGDALGVKGGDGHVGPVGPIVRGAIKVARQYERAGQPIDWVLLGHWHQRVIADYAGVLVSPSFKGACEYSTNGLRVPPSASPAKQLLTFWHASGLVDTQLVRLDDDEPRRQSRGVELPAAA